MPQEMSSVFEVASLVAVVGILLADLIIVRRRPHVPSTRESVTWVLVYVGLAVAFAGMLWWLGGAQPPGEFLAGWVTEYSLSVDNLFVFMLIMGAFAVPKEQQQRVLMVGIILALVLRGAFILTGAAVIEHFSWVFYLFGAFLVYTAVTLLRSGSAQDDEYEENAVVRFARRVLPISREYDGANVRTVVDGKRMFTPLLVVFVAIGTTDVLFAFDSIPAIFGLTHDPFIVFTANVFALMGLRQLYFLIGGLLQRLAYLPVGLAAVLLSFALADRIKTMQREREEAREERAPLPGTGHHRRSHRAVQRTVFPAPDSPGNPAGGEYRSAAFPAASRRG